MSPRGLPLRSEGAFPSLIDAAWWCIIEGRPRLLLSGQEAPRRALAIGTPGMGSADFARIETAAGGDDAR